LVPPRSWSTRRDGEKKSLSSCKYKEVSINKSIGILEVEEKKFRPWFIGYKSTVRAKKAL